MSPNIEKETESESFVFANMTQILVKVCIVVDSDRFAYPDSKASLRSKQINRKACGVGSVKS